MRKETIDKIFHAACIVLVIIITLLRFNHSGIGVGGSTINNYMIYKESFFNLLHDKDIYQAYPLQFVDYYRYSPAFALCFGILAYLPNWLGLMLWNYLNILVLFTGLRQLFKDRDKAFYISIAIVVMECITAMINSQSNSLIAGLIVWGMVLLHQRKLFGAATAIVFAGFIKIYAFAAGIFFISTTKNKIYCLFKCLFLVLAFIPLVVIPWHSFCTMHQSWLDSITAYQTNIQLSVMGLMQTWFGIEPNFTLIQLLGLSITLLPLIQYKNQEKDFQFLFMASLLMFLVIFNQMAESATYIIAVTGCAIWFAMKQKPNKLDIFLLLFMFIFTILSPTDVMPKDWKNNFFEPYKIKTLGVLFIWLKVQVELWVDGRRQEVVV